MSKIIFDEKAKRQLLLSQIYSGISIWIEDLRKYAEEIESCLSKKIKQYESSISSEDDMIEKQQMEMFRELYRSSLFITCYSFFEFELTIICNTLYHQYNIQIKLKNYRREDRDIPVIEKIFDYIKSICNLNISLDSEYAKNIMAYSKIRNNIAHNAGRLVFNYDDIKTFITEHEPRISLNNYGLIIFTKEFISDAINNFYDFFEEFYKVFSLRIEEM